MDEVIAGRYGKHSSRLLRDRIYKDIIRLLPRGDMSREAVLLYLNAKYAKGLRREIYFCHRRKCTFITKRRDCAKRNR